MATATSTVKVREGKLSLEDLRVESFVTTPGDAALAMATMTCGAYYSYATCGLTCGSTTCDGGGPTCGTNTCCCGAC
jgi:hypothetical protein